MNSREMSISKLRSLRKETITQAFVDKVNIKVSVRPVNRIFLLTQAS